MSHDRTKDPSIASTNGVTPGFESASAPGPIETNGQHASYWVLSEQERAKGFVRPVRRKYRHVLGDKACDSVTVMGLALCETYARDPKFYSRTFCSQCRDHFAVAEFCWEEDGASVGS